MDQSPAPENVGAEFYYNDLLGKSGQCVQASSVQDSNGENLDALDQACRLSDHLASVEEVAIPLPDRR